MPLQNRVTPTGDYSRRTPNLGHLSPANQRASSTIPAKKTPAEKSAWSRARLAHLVCEFRELAVARWMGRRSWTQLVFFLTNPTALAAPATGRALSARRTTPVTWTPFSGSLLGREANASRMSAAKEMDRVAANGTARTLARKLPASAPAGDRSRDCPTAPHGGSNQRKVF